MLISGKGHFAREVTDRFECLGYSIKGHLILAADHGVPQRRERVFFLASRHGEVLPPPCTHAERIDGTLPLRPFVTVDEAIGDLPMTGVTRHGEVVPFASSPTTPYQELMRASASEIHNHVVKNPSAHALSIIRQVVPGAGLRSIPVDKLPPRFQRMRTIASGALRKDCTTLYGRMSPVRPSYTITCYFNNVSAGAFTHPSADRAITAREAARLQASRTTLSFMAPTSRGR